ncbi:MAG: tetratricopeptide repeat protein [Candidatus Acidiferrales bacterium]
MELSLKSARNRNLLLAGSVFLAALMIFQAGELWLASRWIDSGDLQRVERGAKLIPSDASAWDKRGHLRQWNLSNSDLPGAIADYRRALRDDPLAAHYWMDLASAEEASGDVLAAKDAFMHAQAVYPDSAEVSFYYGNFLLRQQEYSPAFAALRKAVREDSSLLPLAISRAWRATSDANEIIDHLLPVRVTSYLKAIDYFASIHQCDAALVIWTRLANSKTAVPLPSVFPLVDELISENRSADARRIWLQAASNANQPGGYASESSSMWNGDFAEDFTGGGLGWRWNLLPGIDVSFEAPPPEGRGRALGLEFNGGSNVNLAGPYEYVPVSPAQPYHFHALMRTDAITTESGPRFSISDPSHPGVVSVLTDNFTGTHGWTAVDANFSTGPETAFLIVRLVRTPSRLFDNKLSGTVWIADVSLVPTTDTEPHR